MELDQFQSCELSRKEKGSELGSLPAFPFTRPDLGKLFNISKPQFPYLKMGIIILTSWDGVKIK